jgi:hypothetical protein
MVIKCIKLYDLEAYDGSVPILPTGVYTKWSFNFDPWLWQVTTKSTKWHCDPDLWPAYKVFVLSNAITLTCNPEKQLGFSFRYGDQMFQVVWS